MMKKKSLIKRYQSSYQTRESGNNIKRGVFDWRKVDGDVNFFQPAEGKHRINIIPYTIKSKNHPMVRRGDMEIGDQDYVMDVYVHRNIGATESSVICLKHTYGKPCPICELMAQLHKEGKEEEAKALRPTRRVIYNIEDLKEPGKVKVFETSHYLFERELIEEARDDEGGFIDFADVKDGKEIKFRAAETNIGQNKFNEYKSFSFEDRDEPISNELLQQAISFDEIMEVPSYEDVKKIMLNEDDMEQPGEEEKPAPVEQQDNEEEEEVPVEADEEKPAEEEKPIKKEVSKKIKSTGCPFGYSFGKDTDAYDECDKCDIWDKCVKAGR